MQPQGDSIWGNINLCIEIALNIYYMVGDKGEGIVISREHAEGNFSNRTVAAGKESAAIEGAGARQNVELEVENVQDLEPKRNTVVFPHPMNGGGGHSAIPLNCPFNRKQKAKKKYYRESIRSVIARIREFGQSRLSCLPWSRDIGCGINPVSTERSVLKT